MKTTNCNDNEPNTNRKRAHRCCCLLFSPVQQNENGKWPSLCSYNRNSCSCALFVCLFVRFRIKSNHFDEHLHLIINNYGFYLNRLQLMCVNVNVKCTQQSKISSDQPNTERWYIQLTTHVVHLFRQFSISNFVMYFLVCLFCLFFTIRYVNCILNGSKWYAAECTLYVAAYIYKPEINKAPNSRQQFVDFWCAFNV